eukprot:scaffold1080_cov159-Amphora_coffeaeformis.AAC.4
MLKGPCRVDLYACVICLLVLLAHSPEAVRICQDTVLRGGSIGGTLHHEWFQDNGRFGKQILVGQM